MMYLKEFKSSADSARSFARKNELNEKTFLSWLKTDFLKNPPPSAPLLKSKRRGHVKYLNIEEKLVNDLYIQCHDVSMDKSSRLSYSILRDKARAYAQELLSPDEYMKFKASAGWLNNVLKRNNFLGLNLPDDSIEDDLEESLQFCEMHGPSNRDERDLSLKRRRKTK